MYSFPETQNLVDYVLDPDRGIWHSVIDRSIGPVHGGKKFPFHALPPATIRCAVERPGQLNCGLLRANIESAFIHAGPR